MKKLCIILALLLAIAIPVSAGGSGESGAQDSGKRVFTFWDSIFKTDLNANAYLRTVKEVFEEMHPDVELQIITKGRPEQQIDALTK